MLSVKRIILNNFRNHEHLDIKVNSDLVVITGRNGAGKTNLLEAISLLTSGRGIRNAKPSMFVRQGGDGLWSVFSVIKTQHGEVSIGTGYDREKDKRIVKIDGKVKNGQASLAEHFSVIYLTPQMDRIFSEGTSSRRGFLDSITGNFYPEHTKHLAIYKYAKSERKKLLDMNNQDKIWLSTLEKRMAEQGVAIAAARVEIINAMQKELNDVTIGVSGTLEESIQNIPALQVEEKFMQELESYRKKDRDTGRTNIGVHRSDMTVFHNGKKLPIEFCSTGEQKTTLISITLASAKARKKWTGIAPVFLLDEVTAHLDPVVRKNLFTEIMKLKAQTWITGTTPSLFEDIKDRAEFVVIGTVAR